MKLNRLTVLFTLLFSYSLFAQNKFTIPLKNGAVRPEPNIRQGFLDSFNRRAIRFHNKSMAVLQFERLPSEKQKKELASRGVQLLEYVSGNAYTASLTGDLKTAALSGMEIRSLVELEPFQKISPYLLGGRLPYWAVKAAGAADLWVSFAKSYSVTDIAEELQKRNIQVLSLSRQAYRILSLRMAVNRITELASLPFIEYIQPAPAGDQPLNNESRNTSRASILNAGTALGGSNLNGEGVTVGIGDNSDIQGHIDFKGRLVNRAAITVANHGIHVSGTVGGAGYVDESFRGYASKATLVSQAFSGILSNAPAYIQDYGMVITNNSYGDIVDCDYHGTYDLTSRILDQMAFDYPYLENVFAAGNSGSATCAPFAPGYRTVLGGYQSAKNVISVGSTTDSGVVASNSSRGPVKDGRIKPEVMAIGRFVTSTINGNAYGANNGTSMAAPAVSGGLALLYQRYRQLHSGSNPKNGLMKALVCNGASDLGTAGPDFQYGFGWLNLFRSSRMLEENHYLTDNVAQGATKTHVITVPPNTALLKVMVYWNDPAAALISQHTLVNDLDLKITDPGAVTLLPRILDTSVANLANAATAGEDHINNLEQVVVSSPAPGLYTIRISGTALAQNPSQEYFVVYDMVPVQLQITAPHPSRSLVPNEATRIQWDADGFTAGTATIEFSPDNGANWATVATGIDINRHYYSWNVPAVTAENAILRITKEGTGQSSTSGPFTIIGQPVLSLAPVQCEGYISVNWPAVSGATDYEVMMLQAGDMQTAGITASTSHTFSGLSKDSTYWVSVRARMNGKAGRRAFAISRQPNSGSCSGSVSDNDLKLEALVSPRSARKYTSTSLGPSSVISVRIKNLDDAPSAGFVVSYAINGGPWVSENVSVSMGAGASYLHHFGATADLSASGVYTIVTVVKNMAADPVNANDTLTTIVRNLENQPLDLAAPFADDLETATAATYLQDTIGLEGIERYDYSRSSNAGQARTFVNSGIAYSGSKAITLDANRYFVAGNTNYLYGTFNLSNFTAASNDLRLDFRFLNHNQQFSDQNKVWIRGSEADPWIEVYDLTVNQADAGTYKKTASIEIADSLLNRGQNFSSSFQVRWGQNGQFPATDRYEGAGYTFDDIRVYQVFNDMQLKSIDSPGATGCGLTVNTPITIAVRNSANSTLTGIPVRYRINNGQWITETIAAISGNSVVSHSFAATADLSAPGLYTIQAVVDLTTDSFRDNDTLTATVRNSPVVSNFPYLQDFEAGDGYWFTGGIRSTWEYGIPASNHINGAASGVKAWKTRLTGGYNDNELSYLYSPCFDLSGLTTPALSFSVAMDMEDCGSTLCDGAWLEYSADGTNWQKLGTQATGTNWYNKSENLWSIQDYTYWHVATTALPAGLNRLRLRFVLRTDPGVSREGIAIDDIHIYENSLPIYDGVTMAAPVNQNASGNNWVHFTQNGKLVASLQPNGQNLGSTDAQAYIFTGPVRHTSSQYYHDRNITIKPATLNPADSVSVRFYFLDAEMDSLLSASGCSTCARPTSAYNVGVSTYTDPDRFYENGTVMDNLQGTWRFLQPGAVRIVPFDKGYYAEFKVKSFSEFWLNNGGFDRLTPLPVKLMEFSAQKTNSHTVLLTWEVGSETEVLKYEIEVARGTTQMQGGQFVTIADIASLGNTTSVRQYQVPDEDPDKFGPQYYRLKIINADGSFSYSPIRSVVFDEAILWQVFPNPSKGAFSLVYQLANPEPVKIKVYDVQGRVLKENRSTATGYLQKVSIDLRSYPSGIYLLELEGGGKVQTFKLHKIE